MVQKGINLDIKSWHSMPKEIHEGKWKGYQFREDNSGYIQKNPPVRGVYIVVLSAEGMFQKEPFNLINTVLYIGHSSNIYNRFKQHTKNTSLNSKKINLKQKIRYHTKVKFWYLELDSSPVYLLKEYEQKLIDLFGGPLNDINAVAKGVENVPITGTVKKEE